MKRDIKLQSDRKNPRKPSVVKDYLGWWAQVRTANGGHICKLYTSHADALAKAFELATEHPITEPT